jgi:hypothetical protein
MCFVEWSAMPLRPPLHSLRPPRSASTLGIGLVSWIAAGCWSPAGERLSCEDLLDPSQVSYGALLEKMTGQGEQSCGFPACHGSEVANHGIRFDNESALYDALSTRIDDIYGQVASGKMPRGGTRWGAADLQQLRSWYCYGSFPTP